MTTSLESAEFCYQTQSAADSTNHQLDESTMKSPKNRELTIDLNLITQRSDAANFGPERGYPPPQQPGKEKRKSTLNKNHVGMQRPSYAVSHPVTPQYASYGNGSFVCTTPSLSLPPTPSFLSFYPGAAPIPAPLPSPTYYGHPWQGEATNNPPFLGAEWPSPHYDQAMFVHHNRPWNEARYSGYPAAPYMVSPQRKMPEMREPPRKYKPPTSRAPPKPKQTNSYCSLQTRGTRAKRSSTTGGRTPTRGTRAKRSSTTGGR